MSSRFSESLVHAWYHGSILLYLLLPFSFLYRFVIWLRSQLYRLKLLQRYRSPLPVVVVGNITLGGTGKSPMVAHLVNELKARGFNPGVVSRGYGAKIDKQEWREVEDASLPSEVGDEPLMLKQRLACPVVVSPNRKLSLNALEKTGCDIVIADDGMQHYAMDRDVEICVFDGERQLGNKWVLPAGPLREPVGRLKQVDFCVINGEGWKIPYAKEAYQMRLVPGAMIGLATDRAFVQEENQKIHAVAAIGNPERFFQTLRKMGMRLETHAFDDHHGFKQSDFEFANGEPIIMTEKDAVKCRELSLENAWYLPVEAELSGPLVENVIALLKQKGYFNG